MRGWLLVLAAGLLALGCGKADGAAADVLTGDGALPDTPPLETGCPADWDAAAGTACEADAPVCRAAACEPCGKGTCPTLRCIAGTWRQVLSNNGCAKPWDADAAAHDVLGWNDVDGGADVPFPVEPPAVTPCLGDTTGIRDHRCSPELATCGLEDCTDPCSQCSFLECWNGLWTHAVTLPIPACYPPANNFEGAGDLPCIMAGCAATPVCGQECTSECGCCACEIGQRRCGTEDEIDPVWHDELAFVYECTGECYQRVACAAGDLCVNASPFGVACAAELDSCAAIEPMFAAILESARVCGPGYGCQLIPSACAPGAHGAWAAVSYEQFKDTEASLTALMKRYVELGCATGECDPTPPNEPYGCVGQRCVFAGE